MRSDILVYWTGKNLHPPPHDLADVERVSRPRIPDYVGRLIDILRDGFWMTRPVENLVGRDGASLEYSGAVTCFTEVRLSQTLAMAQRYGLLGIGVDRRYVLERFGAPVHYVRNNESESVVAKAAIVGDALHRLADEGMVAPAVIDAYSGWRSFLKAMSNPGVDDFAFLEENEWRIVYSRAQEEAGRIRRTSAAGADPEFRLELPPDRVRLIVFPTAEIRATAASTPELAAWARHREHPPVLLTIEECLQF